MLVGSESMRRDRVLVACDKFKGSLDARSVAQCVEETLRDNTDVPVRAFLVADGGDGTLEALASAGFDSHPVTVSGPTGEGVRTRFVTRDGDAVVELADACGMIRLPGGRLEPVRASSMGLGQAIRAALETRPRRLVIGVGGSASSDGGAGMLIGLGAVLRDLEGNALPPGAGSLHGVVELDLSGLPPGLGECEIVLASDVDNPLLGPRGAVAVFGRQKGAVGPIAESLESGLRNWERVVRETTGSHAAGMPGAGSAGGVGFAAMAALGATVSSGIALVLELVGFEEALDGARLVITGEGSLDEQTLMGKTVMGVSAAARRHGVPVVAVCGRSSLDAAQAAELGLTAVHPLSDLEPIPERSMANARQLLARTTILVALRHLGGHDEPTWG